MEIYLKILDISPLLKENNRQSLLESNCGLLFKCPTVPAKCIKRAENSFSEGFSAQNLSKTKKTEELSPTDNDIFALKTDKKEYISADIFKNLFSCGEKTKKTSEITASCGDKNLKNAKNEQKNPLNIENSKITIAEVIEMLPDSYKSYLKEAKNADALISRIGVFLILADFWQKNYNTSLPSLEKTERGKPYFKDNPILFSVSHTKKLVCVAFIKKNEQKAMPNGERSLKNSIFSLGVDIETQKTDITEKERERLLKIANRFFSEKESLFLGKLCKEKFTSAFAHLWTQKESLLKMTGEGFSCISRVNEIKAYVQSYEIEYEGVFYSLSLAVR